MIARRHFLNLVPAGAVLLMGRPCAAQAWPHLKEDDPQALAVGYVEDAGRVNRAKFAKFVPGQVCATCDLYVGKPEQEWAPCTLFPRRVVAGKGWCDAWRTREARR